MGIDLILVGVLLVALISGRVPMAGAFLAFILAVLLLERVPSRTVLESLGEPTLVAVLCLVVFSSVLGRLTWLRRLLFSRKPASEGAIRRRFLGMATLVSAVMPNTAVVGALMGPAARNPRIAPRQLLLPLSYVALAGGMITHFGTSANLMTVGQAARAGVEIGFMDFVLAGSVTAFAVYLAVLVAAPRLMRAPKGNEAARLPELFHVEARVIDASPLVGRSLAENHLRSLGHFYVAELIRGDALLSPVRPDEILQSGDVLIFVGDVRFLDELMAIPGLGVMEEVRQRSGLQVHHAVVAQDSALVGLTLKSSNFRAAFSASVFAIRRGDERLSGKLGEVELKAGDLLAIAGGSDFFAHPEVQSNFHLIARDGTPTTALSPREAIIATVMFGLFVVLAIFELTEFALLTLLLVGGAMAFGLLNGRDFRALFPFDLMMALWGSLVLARLVTQAGLDGVVAGMVVDVFGVAGNLATLAVIFVLAWLLTELLSNVAAAVTALPIALQFASLTGLPPEAAAVMAAFGASASFLVPYGYQTHLMVMSPGNYRFSDFLKLGSVVLVVYGLASVVSLWVLSGPLHWWG
ncbi:SLC13 family permease [Roseococcus sp. SDR]|uniref:SLC13 family permease n=1 Tax=Roseococcus sp. SDR TaxID=2835532 RepID=UPI001BD0937A|nr:SLC13 family permease [Roseococcus sp. SDR]MBS7788975.1 SLC13 family permease [Roseococcus sp. SDR]MBV1844289.1 SLC13 family permease [Roseococcus sp. SDR]